MHLFTSTQSLVRKENDIDFLFSRRDILNFKKGANAPLHKTLAAFACQCFHLMISLTYAKIRISWSLPTIELFY